MFTKKSAIFYGEINVLGKPTSLGWRQVPLPETTSQDTGGASLLYNVSTIFLFTISISTFHIILFNHLPGYLLKFSGKWTASVGEFVLLNFCTGLSVSVHLYLLLGNRQIFPQPLSFYPLCWKTKRKITWKKSLRKIRWKKDLWYTAVSSRNIKREHLNAKMISTLFATNSQFIMTFWIPQQLWGMLVVLGGHSVNIGDGYWWF